MQKSKGKLQFYLDTAYQFYMKHKANLFFLAFVEFQNPKDAMEDVKRCFLKNIKLIESSSSIPSDDYKLYRTIYQKAIKKGKEDSKINGNYKSFKEYFDEKELKMIQFVHEALTKRQITAWYLSRSEKIPYEIIATIMASSVEEVRETVADACDILSEKQQDLDLRKLSLAYHNCIGKICEGNEMWASISFQIEKKYRDNRSVVVWMGRIAITLIGIAFVLIALNKGVYAVMTMMLPEVNTKPSYVCNNSLDRQNLQGQEVFAEEYPTISSELITTLDQLPMNQKVNVQFKYYDPKVMEQLKSDGYNLKEIYESAYTLGNENARVNYLCSLTIYEYYKDYDMTTFPSDKKPIYQPIYDDLYECMLEVVKQEKKNGNHIFDTMIETYSDIFKDKTSFYSYLLSDTFYSQSPELRNLLITEDYYSKYRNKEFDLTGEEAKNIGLYYNREIYSYRNQHENGYVTALTYLDYSSQQKIQHTVYQLGNQLKRGLEKSLMGEYELDGVTSMFLDTHDISAYSALMTKEQILEIASKDQRFVFYQLAYPRIPKEYPKNIESKLALQLSQAKSIFEKITVYCVNRNYIPYNKNYEISYQLPEAFIQDIRNLLHCEDSQFETYVGYDFMKCYGHKQTLSAMNLIKLASKNPEWYFYVGDSIFKDVLPREQ